MKKEKITKFVKQNIIFILLLLISIFLEVSVFNHQFFINTFHFLEERHFNIDDGTLYGFDRLNDLLISEHNDPNLTFRDIDQRVRYITIKCTNPNPESFSQVFWRRDGRDFIEENSIKIPLSGAISAIQLPRTTHITSLRLDLTNQADDQLSCHGITINPRIPYKPSFFSIMFFSMSVLGLVWGQKVIPLKFSETFWNILNNYGLWIFIVLIILIGSLYPLTITFDSAHYIWLADLIDQGKWADWDPIRFIGFPMHIFLSINIFGKNMLALQLPMILAHIILLVGSYKIILLVFDSLLDQYRFFISLIIFLVINIDPTIVGYFHTLLTEYIAATIAVVSCYLAIKLYRTAIFSKKFFIISSYFLIMVPIAWHIKQPYIGAALFPFVVVTFLIFLRNVSWKTTVFATSAIVLLATITLLSTYVWNSGIESQGNPMREHRQISTVIENKVENQISYAQQSLSDLIKSRIEHYLKMTNFYLRSSSGGITSKSNFTLGFQNKIIAHRMYFNLGETNLLFNSDYYDQVTSFLKTRYAPPIWINNLLLSRVVTSNILFTTTYLLLPFQLLFIFIFWVRKKSLLLTALLILGGTSFLNAMLHLLANPIDRYLFLGFPLNLLSLIIITVKAFLILTKEKIK
jgi:hypothetical protein